MPEKNVCVTMCVIMCVFNNVCNSVCVVMCVIMLYNNMCKIFIGRVPKKNMSMRAITGICKLYNLKFILLF